MQSQASCLIVGGGISGLIAAKVLQERQIATTVLDKGKGIGGRLATRRIAVHSGAKGVFDYGAPHFQATDPRFQKLVDKWLQSGLVKEWCWGFPDIKGAIQKSDRPEGSARSDRPYYCGVESNRSIAADLAQGLDVRTGTRIARLQHENGIWIAIAENGDRFQGEGLIITAPVPQSLELLDTSQINVPLEINERLHKISYSRCLAVLALLEKESKIPEPGGLWGDGKVLSWLCCDRKKGISPALPTVTLLATPEFSLTNWDADRALVARHLLNAAEPWLGAGIISYQVHGWKFSQPETFYGQPYAALTAPGLAVLAGDAFSERGNVEGAVLSGWAAGEYAAEVLGKSSI